MRKALFCIGWTAILVVSYPVIAADTVDVVKDFGCPQDGTRDVAKVINRAIREANGKTICIPKGVYLLEESLVPVSGTQLVLDPQAEMRRGFDGGNGTQTGALIQGDKSLKTTDVQIRGGRWTNPGHRWVGRVFAILGNRWTLDSVQVDSWGTPSQGSICISVLGNDVAIRNCRAVGSAGREGQAGIRIESGKHIRVSDCYIEAGDDAFCAFPTERARSFGAGLPIEDVVFERCRGKSLKARFLACGLTAVNSLVKKNATLADLNNISVSGISFVDCHGESVCEKPFAPAFFVVCANPNKGAAVHDVKFVRCSGEVAATADQCVKITATEGAVCRGITLDDCRLLGGTKELVTVGKGCRDVSVKLAKGKSAGQR
jgi:hypothetical protein